jgi:hypothetical protein
VLVITTGAWLGVKEPVAAASGGVKIITSDGTPKDCQVNKLGDINVVWWSVGGRPNVQSIYIQLNGIKAHTVKTRYENLPSREVMGRGSAQLCNIINPYYAIIGEENPYSYGWYYFGGNSSCYVASCAVAGNNEERTNSLLQDPISDWINFFVGFDGNDSKNTLYLYLNNQLIAKKHGSQITGYPYDRSLDENQPATPVESKVLVDGKSVSLNSYLIADYTYVKLRDVAMALNGTQASFDVDYQNGDITITTGVPYKPVGDELLPLDRSKVSANMTTTIVTRDETARPLGDGIQPPNENPIATIPLHAYNIGGNNYYKLRDLGYALGFNVSWSKPLQQIVVDTTTIYQPDYEGPEIGYVLHSSYYLRRETLDETEWIGVRPETIDNLRQWTEKLKNEYGVK